MRVALADIDLAGRVEALLGRPLGDEEPIAVAVSGGADSLALLLLTCDAFGDRTRALTVDHGFRAASKDEAAAVAAVCARLDVPHATLTWAGPKPASNRQAEARAARYRLMADWCLSQGVGLLMTAHHADDQAETVLMRLSRGSGVSGLGGIREVRKVNAEVTLFRPLLGITRNLLKHIVLDADLVPVDDPSNADPAFDRTNARALLADASWLDAGRIAASADHLRAADEALEWASDLAWRSRAAVGSGGVVLDAGGLPAELVRRVVVRALAALDERDPDGPAVARLTTRLQAGGVATIGGVRATGGRLWRFAPAPPRRPVKSR